MTSLIGNKKKGFTFVEVMVAIMILTTGIVAIYKTFLLSLDQQNYLTHRLYASNLLDKKIFEMERLFQEKGIAALKEDLTENVVVDNKNLVFQVKTFFRAPLEIPDLEDVLQIDIGVFWPEHGRVVRLTRAAYVSRY